MKSIVNYNLEEKLVAVNYQGVSSKREATKFIREEGFEGAVLRLVMKIENLNIYRIVTKEEKDKIVDAHCKQEERDLRRNHGC